MIHLILTLGDICLLYLSPCSPDDQIGEEEEGEGIVLGGAPKYPWEGTDRDYKYEEVLKYMSTKFFLKACIFLHWLLIYYRQLIIR